MSIIESLGLDHNPQFSMDLHEALYNFVAKIDDGLLDYCYQSGIYQMSIGSSYKKSLINAVKKYAIHAAAFPTDLNERKV